MSRVIVHLDADAFFTAVEQAAVFNREQLPDPAEATEFADRIISRQNFLHALPILAARAGRQPLAELDSYAPRFLFGP